MYLLTLVLIKLLRVVRRQLTQSSTVITLLITISAEALQNLCSATLIIPREQERGFGMTAQGQVGGGDGTLGAEIRERERK